MTDLNDWIETELPKIPGGSGYVHRVVWAAWEAATTAERNRALLHACDCNDTQDMAEAVDP